MSLVGLNNSCGVFGRMPGTRQVRADLVSGRDGGERAFPTVGAREGLHGLSLEDVGSSPPPP